MDFCAILNTYALLVYCVLLETLAASSLAKVIVHKFPPPGEKCRFKARGISPGETHRIIWNGTAVPSHAICDISFIGRDKENLMQGFRVCAKSVQYKVDICDFKLFYSYGVSRDPEEVFGCGNNSVAFCAIKNEYTYIGLVAPSSSPTSFVQLDVTIEDVNSNDENEQTVLLKEHMDGAIIGVLIGMAVGVFIVGSFVLYKCIRRHHNSPPSSPQTGASYEIKPMKASSIFKVKKPSKEEHPGTYAPVKQNVV